MWKAEHGRAYDEALLLHHSDSRGPLKRLVIVSGLIKAIVHAGTATCVLHAYLQCFARRMAGVPRRQSQLSKYWSPLSECKKRLMVRG